MKKMDFSHCFICGKNNPDGLHLKVEDGQERARAVWVAEDKYVGYENVLHGGILCSILDDLMGHAVFSLDVDAFTAHLEIDYRTPAFAGDELVCEAHIVKRGKGRSIHLEGTVFRGDTLVAEAKGVLVIVGQDDR